MVLIAYRINMQVWLCGLEALNCQSCKYFVWTEITDRVRSLSWLQSSISGAINFLSTCAIVRFIIAEGHAVVGRVLCFYIFSIFSMNCTQGFTCWYDMYNLKLVLQKPREKGKCKCIMMKIAVCVNWGSTWGGIRHW